ncbi:qor, partial [Mucuna pruriens]
MELRGLNLLVVTTLGVGLIDTKVGDVVAYAGQILGSYTEEQILPANRLVPAPPSLDPNVMAIIFDKGLTSRYLIRECWKESTGSPGPFLAPMEFTSLYLTKPSKMHDNSHRDQLLEAVGEVFAKVISGDLNVRINHTYPLFKATQAHQDLENGNTTLCWFPKDIKEV